MSGPAATAPLPSAGRPLPPRTARPQPPPAPAEPRGRCRAEAAPLPSGPGRAPPAPRACRPGNRTCPRPPRSLPPRAAPAASGHRRFRCRARGGRAAIEFLRGERQSVTRPPWPGGCRGCRSLLPPPVPAPETSLSAGEERRGVGTGPACPVPPQVGKRVIPEAKVEAVWLVPLSRRQPGLWKRAWLRWARSSFPGSGV